MPPSQLIPLTSFKAAAWHQGDRAVLVPEGQSYGALLEQQVSQLVAGAQPAEPATETGGARSGAEAVSAAVPGAEGDGGGEEAAEPTSGGWLPMLSG